MPELHLHYRATRFTHFLPGRVPAEWPESVQSPEHGNRAMQRSSRDGASFSICQSPAPPLQ
ncbi:MAG: hypothetical protein OXD45_15435 [Rhodobacteraceae bacterium]|nr:hypothetical protein [Paracoccaceae bacterium]